MISIRPAVDADLPALGRLLEQRDACRYEGVAVRRHYLGLDASHVRTLVAELDGRIVATSTVLLRQLVRGSRSLPAAYWTDLYVDEACRRHMLYLPLARATLDAAEQAGAEFVYTANRRPEVYRAHQKLGFRIAGVMTTRARPVRPLGLVARIAAGERVASMTAPFDAMLVAGLGKLEKRSLVRDSTLHTSVERLTEAGMSRLLPRLERANRGWLAQKVSPEQLSRRFQTPLDGREYQLIVAQRGADLVGYAIVRTARRGRFEATVLLDLVGGGERSAAHALVAAVETFAAEQGSDLVLVLDASPDLDGLWDEAGYRITPEHYVLLVAPAERALDPLLGNSSGWRFSFADHDAF